MISLSLSLFLSLSLLFLPPLARFSVRLEGAVAARCRLDRCGGCAVRLEAALDNDVIWMTHHIAQEIALLEALSLSDPLRRCDNGEKPHVSLPTAS